MKESFSEKLSLVVSAVSRVGHSLVVIVVNVGVSDYSGELNLVKLFGLKQVHLLQFAHAFNQLQVLIKSVGFLLNRHYETLGGGCFLFFVVQGAAQKS